MMPVTATLGALTSLKGIQSLYPGSGYWKPTTSGVAPRVGLAPQGSLATNCWANTGYTFEFYVNYLNRGTPTPPLTNRLLFGSFNPGFAWAWYITVTDTGRIVFSWNGGVGIQSADAAVSSSQWTNLAMSFVTSSGNTTIRLFKNGILTNTQLQTGGPFSSSQTITTPTVITNTALTFGPEYLGYSLQSILVDELRVSNTTRYTASYSLDSNPFVPDSDTQLLCHFNLDVNDNPLNPEIIDSSFNNYNTTNYTPYVTINTNNFIF